MGKKGFYKGMILREFYFSGTISCAELSDKIAKSLPFTMNLLSELIDEGFIKESGYAPSSGGRRPIMYTIQPDKIYVVAVAMDQLVTRISVMDIYNKHVGDIERFELPLANN